jgi:hypothetical protein
LVRAKEVTLIDSDLTDRAEAYQVLAAAKDAKKVRVLKKLSPTLSDLKNIKNSI